MGNIATYNLNMDHNVERVNMNRSQAEKPAWIRGKVSWDENFNSVKTIISDLGLHSVCVSAACPNKGECWKAKHVTFMILGDTCTRGCLFCNIKGGSPCAPEALEPDNVAKAVKDLGIKYAVITSVTRDDLKDGGVSQFVRTVKSIKESSSGTLIELLIPDMNADESLLAKTVSSGAEVIGHNIEMPEPLYAEVRPKSSYERSLAALKFLSGLKERYGFRLKSAIMIGLGEKEADIEETLKDLRSAGVDIVYIGQYLNPTNGHWPVKKYYTPEEFSAFEGMAKNMGFKAVLAGPMVRSSYRAYEAYRACRSSLD